MLSNSLLAQDWPQLSYYQEANKLLKTSEKPIEAVFFGDSITEGWPQFNPSFFDSNNFVGRGIGGQTTPQLLLRFRQDVFWPSAKESNLTCRNQRYRKKYGPHLARGYYGQY